MKNTNKFGEILGTRDYNLFKYVLGNRTLKDSNVHNLVESIKNKNLLHLNPIIVNESFEIIDGQHRLQACKILNIPIYYVMYKGTELEDVRALNTAQLRWGLQDYISSYCQQGNQNYIRFDNLCKKFNISPIKIGYMLLSKHDMGSKSIKSGNLEFSDIDYMKGIIFINRILDFKKYYRYFPSALISAFRLLNEIKGYNHTSFVENLARNQNKLKYYNTRREYLVLFDEVYNYGKQKKLDILRLTSLKNNGGLTKEGVE